MATRATLNSKQLQRNEKRPKFLDRKDFHTISRPRWASPFVEAEKVIATLA